MVSLLLDGEDSEDYGRARTSSSFLADVGQASSPTTSSNIESCITAVTKVPAMGRSERPEEDFTTSPSSNSFDSVYDDNAAHSTHRLAFRNDPTKRSWRNASSFPSLETMCYLAGIAFVFVVAILIIVYTAAVHPLTGDRSVAGTRTGRSACYCGKNIAEALERNCRFDVLASAWLPDHCRNDSLTAEFARSGPGPAGEWTYYADKNLSQVVDMDYVKSLSGDVTAHYWVTWEYHIVHCFYNWQKQQYAREGGVVMEERFDAIGHSKHCVEAFLNPRPAAASAVFDSSEASQRHDGPPPA